MTGFGHHSTRIRGRDAGSATGCASARAHLGCQGAASRSDAERAGDPLDVAVDVLDRLRSEDEGREPRALQRFDDPLVPRNGERREDEVGLEPLHALDVDAEIRTDLRQASHHFDRVVGVVVDADEEISAAERADDLRVRAGVADDS